MEPVISAIIPIYNAEKYLNICIESLLGQSEPNIEIILINDGSTDNSLTIAYDYSQKDSRIKVITQENLGPSAARNKGIDIATGQFLSFIDADDWIDFNMYEKMLAHVKHCKADIIFSNLRINKRNITVESGPIRALKHSSFNKKEIEQYMIPFALEFGKLNTMAPNLYRRELITENRINLNNEIRYGEDWLFNLECLKYCDHVLYVDQCFYNYRKHITSSSSGYNDTIFETNGKTIYLLAKDYAQYFGHDLYCGGPHFLNITIHCVISEYKRKDIEFKEKITKIKTMLNDSILKEALMNTDLRKFSFKHRIYALLIKYRFSWAICWYFSIRKSFIN